MQGPTQQQQAKNKQLSKDIESEFPTQRIIINNSSNKIQVKNIKQNLTYLIISTEPGRRIYYPPVFQDNNLQFRYHKCQGISLQNEGYCAIGYDRSLGQTIQCINKKPISSVTQKVLYISKVSIIYKLNSKNYYKNQDEKYNFTAYSEPPQDITALQIQEFLLKIVQNYGQVVKVDVKRNCLMLFFAQDLTIKQHFIIKELKKNSNKDFVLTYWAMTCHRTLYTYQPISLIQMPLVEQITNFLIHSEWLIITTENDVIFLHLYRPTQNFLNLNDIKIQAIAPIDSDRIILFEYKFLHVYQLFTNKNPELLGKAKIKKLQSFTVAFRKKTALFGGINYSNILNQPIQQKQIFVIQNFKSCNYVQKSFLPDKKLQICKKNPNIPITNLKHIGRSDLFVCSCGQSIYIFHFQASSLIASVDLSARVQKLYEIQYPINVVNCLASVDGYKNLIRVSFQQYGEIVGAEVTNLQKYGNCIDFYAQAKQVYCLDGDNLILYGSSDKSRVIYSCENQSQKMMKLSVQKQFLGFLLQKKNIIQAYFIEL